MRKFYTFLTLIALMIILVIPSHASRWSAEVGLWRATLNGSNFTVSNFNVDLSNEMSLTDSSSPYLKVNYSMGRKWALHLEYFNHSFNGFTSRTATQTFPYEGPGYTHIEVQGTFNLDSKFDMWALDGSVTYNLMKGRTGYLSAVLGVRYLSIDLYGHFTGNFNVFFYNGNTLVGQSNGQTNLEASYSIEGPVPYLGLGGELKLSKEISLVAFYRGISYQGGDFNASFSDLTAELSWQLNDRLNLNIGYKDQELNYKDSDGREGTISTRGPVLSLRYKF